MPRSWISFGALALAAAIVIAAAIPGPAYRNPEAVKDLPSIRTSFLPSKDGYSFRNPKPDPQLSAWENATSGRCGGMAYASVDHFIAGKEPRAADVKDGYLNTRNNRSIVENFSRFVLWSVSPDVSDSMLLEGVGEMTRADELPRLATALERGPAPIGLVRARKAGDIGLNHQVVAYAIERKGDIARVFVYDSCQPLGDDVVLEVDLRNPSAPIREYAGTTLVATWRGLFVETYEPVEPPKARL